jgi:flagellar hook-associated protein 3 FlgL
MSNLIGRIGTFSSSENLLRNLATRQQSLDQAQHQVATGKRVLKASDDPSAAAQAERAIMRIERIKSEQRVMDLQRSNLTLAEASLGDGISALQRIRELVITAGNSSLDTVQREGITNEIASLRKSLLGYANRQDANGLPLFGGLGSIKTPFVETNSGVDYQGLSGQMNSTEVSVPAALDGQRIWMFVPVRDGVFDASFSVNAGGLSSTAPQIDDLSKLVDRSYTIEFSGTTYSVTSNVSTGDDDPLPLIDVPFVSGEAITFDGLSIQVRGNPVAGDTLVVEPTRSIFQAIDNVVAALNEASSGLQVFQGINQALASIDSGLYQLQAARSQSGELLNTADRIENTQEGLELQLEESRSRAEDLDMAEGITKLQSQQLAYEIALKSYAKNQNLSLFNYLD